VLFSFICRAQLWVDSLCVPYSAQTWKVGCSQHFSGTDFISTGYILLNRMVVPTFCSTPSHPHSTPQPTELNLSVSSSSPLIASPDYLPVQKPIKTYYKLSIRVSTIFSIAEPSIPHGYVNLNACGGELEGVSLQSSFPKRKARHFVLKTLIWTELLSWHQGKRNRITWFGSESFLLASLGKIQAKESEEGLSFG
jgi:hypothetical protein